MFSWFNYLIHVFFQFLDVLQPLSNNHDSSHVGRIPPATPAYCITIICLPTKKKHNTLENWRFTWKWWLSKKKTFGEVSPNTHCIGLHVFFAANKALSHATQHVNEGLRRWWPVQSSWSQWGCIGEKHRNLRIKKPNSSRIFRKMNSMPPY